MTFELPEKREGTASKLRDLEASAPNPVPKAIKAAMIQAAQELEAWRNLADDIAAVLEEMTKVRISAMATTSQVEDIQKRQKGQILEAVRRLREMP